MIDWLQVALANIQQQSFFWMAMTLFTFWIGQHIYRLLGNTPLLPPILTSFSLLVILLLVFDTPYREYQAAVLPLQMLLGPTVVMLAVPLYQAFAAIRQDAWRIILAVSLGSTTTVAVAVELCYWLIGEAVIMNSLWTKSVTTPLAVVLAPELGGLAALAAAFILVTGLFGAILIPPLLKICRLDSPQATGLSLGVCAHAIGTSRALELGTEQAAFSALAMTLTASLFAFVLPWLI